MQVTSILSFSEYCSGTVTTGQINVATLLQRANHCSNGQISVPTSNSLFPTGFLLPLAINKLSQVFRNHP